MANCIACPFLVVYIMMFKNIYGFTELSNGNNGDPKLMMKLMEKIDALERKVEKMEKNEKPTMDSIRALIQTNVQFRLSISEHKKIEQTLEKRLKELEKKSKDKDRVIEMLKNIFEFRRSGSKDFCVKSGIPSCIDVEKETHSHNVSESRDRNKRLVLSEPIRPAFTAYLDHPIKTLGMNQAIVYNRVLLNDGNAYNNSSGIFTASIPGVYLFSWAVTARKLSGESAYDIWVKLVVNGKHTLGAVAESRDDSDDNQGSNTAILRLKQGDQVWLSHYSSYPNIHGDDAERTTSFSGILLFQE